jgi:D-alanyl-D-alanine carboxypeptidase (penicillin-binding protein 5/6)
VRIVLHLGRKARPAGLHIVLLAAVTFAFAPRAVLAQGHQRSTNDAPNISARHAVLMDYENGSYLYERDADTPVPPASLTKLMTMELVFQALEERTLSLDQELLISPYAWRHGGAPSHGSTMFASVNSKVPVEDLIQGVVVVSGNDAAIAFAEALDGNENYFAQHMTKRAHELGLNSASFRNATGLDDPDHKISVRDLAKLSAHLIRDYPDYYKYFSQPEFTWNKIKQKNRNPLLDMDIGADGLKTGYTKESGYGLVGSAVQNGIRLIVVVNDAPTAKERAEDAKRLLEWGFRNFDPKPLVKDGETVAYAQVFGGDSRYVPLVAGKQVRIFSPHNATGRLLIRVVYTGPLQAPVVKGTHVAQLKVWREKRLVLDAPLYAAADVGKGGMVRRAVDGAYELTVDLIRTALSKLKRG